MLGFDAISSFAISDFTINDFYMSNPKKVILGDDISWIFQPIQYTIPILASTADSPIVITTQHNNTIQTNDNVRVLHSHIGNLGTNSNNGNFVATRIDSKTLSLQGSTGVNPGTGGSLALCMDGTGYTDIVCSIQASHTKGAQVFITGTFAWIEQNIFRFNFTFDPTAFAAAVAIGDWARVIYWTDPNSKELTVIRDFISVQSR